jgi:hypothetical protein
VTLPPDGEFTFEGIELDGKFERQDYDFKWLEEAVVDDRPAFHL